MTIVSSDVELAANFLKEGKVVAIPTETVYGLAANIFREEAVKQIFELKKRPLFNPLIVHIHSIQQLNELVEEIPIKAKQLIDAFWPGELTLVLKKQTNVPDLITANKATVAVRMPRHPLMIQLLQKLDFPVAAPSANPFSSISPTNALRVKNYFNDQLSMVLDGGDCSSGIESTIIGFDGKDPILYRMGSISIEAIENEIGKVQILTKKNHEPEAPGMLLKHYSPSTPLLLADDLPQAISNLEDQRIGVLLFSKPMNEDVIHQEVLSTNANLTEAATNLYEAMHRLDALGLDLIIAERLPDQGLGKSINDRLERASAEK